MQSWLQSLANRLRAQQRLLFWAMIAALLFLIAYANVQSVRALLGLPTFGLAFSVLLWLLPLNLLVLAFPATRNDHSSGRSPVLQASRALAPPTIAILLLLAVIYSFATLQTLLGWP